MFSSEWFWLFVLSQCAFQVFGGVLNPGDITKTEGIDKKAIFFWNTTGSSILEAKWGIFDGTTVEPFFIKVNTLQPGVIQYSPDLDTNQASEYKNRVHFIGNISLGRAWFVLTNISTSDTKEYAARIREVGDVSKVFRVKLTVSPAPTKISPTITTKVTTSIASPFPNGTDKTTTEVTTAKSTPKPHHLNPGEIVGIVIGVLVVIAIIVGLIVWYVKKSKNNGSNGSNNKSGPLEMDKPTGDGNRTSPEA